MGQAKRELIEIDEQGWQDVGTIVCTDCIVDEALVQAIRANNGSSACSYCERLPRSPAASAPLEVVLRLIVDGFRYEYEDPIEHMGRDDEWVGTVHELSDLLWEFQATERTDVHEALNDAIVQDQWCQKDPYAESPTQALTWGWKAFRRFVKNNRRLPDIQDGKADALGAGAIPKHDMPSALVQSVLEAGLVRTLPASTDWWRIRVHNAGERYTAAADIGTPKDEFAQHNRMSPKGLGAFYGASTRDGARKEVAGYAETTAEGTIGLFRTARPLDVLDLTDLPDVPSLFDPDRRHLRAPILFLNGFVRDVTEVAEPSDDEKLDYIPTQKVAEIFRTEIAGKEGPLAGIMWRSSKDKMVTSCVLFIPSSEVADAGAEDSNTRLSLDPTSVKTLPAPL